MIFNRNINLDKQYYCFDCGKRVYPRDLKDHVCFDAGAYLSINPAKARWHQRFLNWVGDNFAGCCGVMGILITFPIIAQHFNFNIFESILFGLGAGYISAYLFIIARNIELLAQQG